MSTVKSSGRILKDINNRAYAKYETEYSELVAAALEDSSIPYFARYSLTELSLTYDSEYSIQVEEIIKKCTSGECRNLLREIKNRKNKSGYAAILPEIAEILETSVGILKSRPAELQELLCKTYTDLWFCDSETIRKRLSDLLMTEPHINEKVNKKHEFER